MRWRFDNGGKMNCHQVKESLSAFIDKELDADQTNALKAHLIRCPSCRQQRDVLEEIGRGIRHMPPVTAPEDFQFRVYSSIRRYQARKSSRSFWRWQTVLVPAAAMVFGIVIGVTTNDIINPGTSQPLMMASDHQALGMLPETAVADEGVIRNYTLDRYVQGSMIPVDVMTIPDLPSDSANQTPAPENRTDTRNQTNPQYVLDNIPMRVSYERTIY